MMKRTNSRKKVSWLGKSPKKRQKVEVWKYKCTNCKKQMDRLEYLLQDNHRTMMNHFMLLLVFVPLTTIMLVSTLIMEYWYWIGFNIGMFIPPIILFSFLSKKDKMNKKQLRIRYNQK